MGAAPDDVGRATLRIAGSAASRTAGRCDAGPQTPLGELRLAQAVVDRLIGGALASGRCGIPASDLARALRVPVDAVLRVADGLRVARHVVVALRDGAGGAVALYLIDADWLGAYGEVLRDDDAQESRAGGRWASRRGGGR